MIDAEINSWAFYRIVARLAWRRITKLAAGLINPNVEINI